MPKNRPRPSGTWAIPSRARALGELRARSSPPNRTRPAIGRTRPETTRSVVVLPAPFAPSSATTSPAPTVSSTSRITAASSYPAVSVSTASTASATGLLAGGEPRGGTAEVGTDHPRVVANDVGGAAGDHLAELQHDHLVADPEHEPHVVVDQQHRLPVVGETA